ncbi:zinc ribbon domain-containing protein [bacterium]|nr:zinc ribbon domain-containing protein [bacterium]MBU0899506.1 zinc ribbon domain-containing protein [bacterium]MBU1153454.1 zinc ribbon domain-containing protein [bacterium]MBU2599692.1 zinc ribbon domain-containing protein [bacterium]
MPLYEYACQDCKNKFEMLVFGKPKTQLRCPKCNSSEVEKLFSLFGINKGSLDSNSTSSSTSNYSSSCHSCSTHHCGSCS